MKKITVYCDEDLHGTMQTLQFKSHDISVTHFNGGRAIIVLLDKKRKPYRWELLRMVHRVTIHSRK